MNNILLGLFFLILGMLIANMLNNICGCRDLVEGISPTSIIKPKSTPTPTPTPTPKLTSKLTSKPKLKPITKPKSKPVITPAPASEQCTFNPGKRYILSAEDGNIIAQIYN